MEFRFRSKMSKFLKNFILILSDCFESFGSESKRAKFYFYSVKQIRFSFVNNLNVSFLKLMENCNQPKIQE